MSSAEIASAASAIMSVSQARVKHSEVPRKRISLAKAIRTLTTHHSKDRMQDRKFRSKTGRTGAPAAASASPAIDEATEPIGKIRSDLAFYKFVQVSNEQVLAEAEARFEPAVKNIKCFEGFSAHYVNCDGMEGLPVAIEESTEAYTESRLQADRYVAGEIRLLQRWPRRGQTSEATFRTACDILADLSKKRLAALERQLERARAESDFVQCRIMELIELIPEKPMEPVKDYEGVD